MNLIELIYQPYPEWVIRACDAIAIKDDNVALSNTEAEASIIYMSGSLFEEGAP